MPSSVSVGAQVNRHGGGLAARPFEQRVNRRQRAETASLISTTSPGRSTRSDGGRKQRELHRSPQRQLEGLAVQIDGLAFLVAAGNQADGSRRSVRSCLAAKPT